MFDDYKGSDLFPSIKEKLGDMKLIDFIEKILNPVSNKFKLVSYNNDTILTKRAMGHEVWFNSPSLLIYEHTLQEAIKSNKKKK